jgi:hypothetical protein
MLVLEEGSDEVDAFISDATKKAKLETHSSLLGSRKSLKNRSNPVDSLPLDSRHLGVGYKNNSVILLLNNLSLLTEIQNPSSEKEVDQIANEQNKDSKMLIEKVLEIDLLNLELDREQI